MGLNFVPEEAIYIYFFAISNFEVVQLFSQQFAPPKTYA